MIELNHQEKRLTRFSNVEQVEKLTRENDETSNVHFSLRLFEVIKKTKMKHHREENPNESVHRIDSNEVCFFFSSVHFQFTSTSTTNLLNEVMEAFTALYTNKESADSMTTSSVCSFSF